MTINVNGPPHPTSEKRDTERKTIYMVVMRN